METNITIVGGGASCISFIDALLEGSLDEKSNKLSLTVFEKSQEIGPGNAYCNDSKSNLLNTKAGYITVFKGHPGDFYNWLECNEYKWRPSFPELKVTPNTYVPRALFGMYMKDAFSYICASASRRGIKVKVIRDEVINVEQAEDGRVNVTSKNSGVIVANKVVLACGSQQNAEILKPYSSKIINSPYPTQELKHKVATSDSVAIIGARLSAIDTVIALVEGGHTGPITIYSRSGYFPYVRGTQGRYENFFLTPDYIEKYCPTLDFGKLKDLYLRECERYKKQSDDEYFEDLPLPNDPIQSLEDFLTKELKLAQSNRGWQAILYDTNKGIDRMWDRLKSEEQKIFINQYFSSAVSLRVSIPAENAEKILGYLRSGALKFVVGASSVEMEDGGLVVRCNNCSTPINKVIYATGSPKSLSQVDSPLIRNLIESGTSVENKFGGLDVCKNDYGLFGKEGNMSPSIFAIGELTSGRFLFTSALDITVRHAHACAKSIERFILERDYSLPLVKPMELV